MNCTQCYKDCVQFTFAVQYLMLKPWLMLEILIKIFKGLYIGAKALINIGNSDQHSEKAIY